MINSANKLLVLIGDRSIHTGIRDLQDECHHGSPAFRTGKDHRALLEDQTP